MSRRPFAVSLRWFASAFDGKTPLHFCRGVEVAHVLLTAGLALTRR